MVRALILNAIDPRIGGVLIRGERGTAKSTAARGLAAVLPEEEVIAECRFGCDPDDELHWCTECKERKAKGIPMTRTRRKTPFINLPVSATEDRVVGTLDIEKALKTGEKSFEPGILASANRGILYIDEVNLLEDHVVDILLDNLDRLGRGRDGLGRVRVAEEGGQRHGLRGPKRQVVPGDLSAREPCQRLAGGGVPAGPHRMEFLGADLTLEPEGHGGVAGPAAGGLADASVVLVDPVRDRCQVVALTAPRKLFLAWGAQDEGTPEPMFRAFVDAIEQRCAEESLPPSVFPFEEADVGHQVTEASLAAGLASASIYLLMAAVLIVRPQGLFPAKP